MAALPPTDETITVLADSLTRCAEQIEGTFARVGERLGEGLTLFETLNGSLSALSGEMASGDMEELRAALSRLAGELRAFGDGLPIETETLQAIAARNVEASRALGLLREHVQLIAILARSTRIEAASVPSSRGDLGDFANKIVALTGEAKRTVDGCARDHDRLTRLLGEALDQQRDFVALYRDSLSLVAGKLERSVVALGERRDGSVALTADAGVHAAKISGAVGGAIMSLQSGDSIRQRLEHCLAGLRLAIEAGAGDGPASLDWAGVDRAALDAVLRGLEAAQLRATAVALRADVGKIDAALRVLVDDTATMVGLGRSLYGGGRDAPNSFLDALEAELAEASVLMTKCDAARGVVDRATESLTDLLDQFQQTVAGLSEIVRDIVMIGTNAGLLAGRLGGDGRGLVVIAGEVKAVADHVARDSGKLGPIFNSMQTASVTLRERERRGAYDATALEQTMKRSLDQMRQSGLRLNATLDRLTRDGEQFGTVVGESRRMFSKAAESGGEIAAAAEALDQVRPSKIAIAPADAAGVEAMLRRQILPTYTMAAERDIYATVLEDHGLGDRATSGRAAAR